MATVDSSLITLIVMSSNLIQKVRMPNRSSIGITNTSFRARRQPVSNRPALIAGVQFRPAVGSSVTPLFTASNSSQRPHSGLISDFKLVAPQPFAVPAHPRLQQSKVLRRQAVRSPSANTIPQPATRLQLETHQPQTTIAKKPVFKRYYLGAAVGLGLIVIAVAGLLLANSRSVPTTIAASQTPAIEIVPAPDSRPAEIKPTATSMGSYRVPDYAPRQIIIPKLYVYSRVRPLSVNGRNQLQAPGNIYDSGWYSASAKPGMAGTLLLDGYTEGPTKPGVFASLSKLVAGDVIQIVRGDGKTLSYSVNKTQMLPITSVNLSQLMSPGVAGKSGLNLVTTSGPFDKNSSNNQMTIISAGQTDLTVNQK